MEVQGSLKRIIDFTDVRHLCRILRDEFNMSEDCILAKRIDNKGLLELELDNNIRLENLDNDGLSIYNIVTNCGTIMGFDILCYLKEDEEICEQDFHDMYLLHALSKLNSYKEEGGLDRFKTDLVVPSYNDIKLLLELANNMEGVKNRRTRFPNKSKLNYSKDKYTEKIKHDLNILPNILIKPEDNYVIVESDKWIARLPIVVYLMRPNNLVIVLNTMCDKIVAEYN